MSAKKSVLIFHASQPDAAKLFSAIQQASGPIQGSHVGLIERLAPAVKKQPWSLIVLSLKEEGLASKVLALARQSAPNTPIVAVLDQCDEKIRYKLMKMGAADAVSIGETELLALVARQWMSIRALPVADVNGVATAQDQMKHDPVTGLVHIDSFKSLLQQRIEQGLTDHTAIFVVQFDCLKESDKSIAPEYRNLALSDLAKLVQRDLPSDYVARLGEDGFVFALDQTDAGKTEACANELYAWLQGNHIEVNNAPIQTGCTIGASHCHESCSGDAMLAQAITACGIASSGGGERVHVYNEHEDGASCSLEESKWIAAIKRALKENRFRAVYQPIVNLSSAPSEKYEVLLRMLDDGGNEILPGKFLGAAAAAGLMTAIDRWVITDACEKLGKRHTQGSKTQFFVKLSKESLLDQSLIVFIGEQLRTARLPGNSLVFEVTEAAACDHPQQTKQLFEALKQLNCLTALDHVGVVPSSSITPNGIQADYVKIAGSLIGELSDNKESQQKVRNIVIEARSKNILTIAQFVQSADTLAFLWQCGVNYIQGYYFQRPDTALVYDFTEGDK